MKAHWSALAALGLLTACSTVPGDLRWAQACPTDMHRAPGPGGEGVVLRFLDREQAMATLGRTETNLGIPIDRAYLNNPRAVIRMPDGRDATALVPFGLTVNVGDHVAFQGDYRSPDLPCAYIPNLVTRKF